MSRSAAYRFCTNVARNRTRSSHFGSRTICLMKPSFGTFCLARAIEWSTLLHHEQVTWGEGTTAFDEHVFHGPKTLRRYSSAGQWAALRQIFRPERRPQARFYGGLTAHDSHAVNILMLKHGREVPPATDVMLPSYCIQHHLCGPPRALHHIKVLAK